MFCLLKSDSYPHFFFHLSEYILVAATDGQWKEASKALSTDHPTRKDKIRVSGAVQHPSL